MQVIRIFCWMALLGSLLCMPTFLISQESRAYTLQTVPDPKKGMGGYVSDPGKVLSTEEVATLNQLIQGMEDSTTAQMAVVVLPSIGEEEPREFATALFEKWGIGQADVDNGLLILVVLDQRRTEFETGYGLEGVLPDITCYRVGMEVLVPYFQKQEYGQGLIATVTRFKAILENPESVTEITSDRRSSTSGKGDGGWIVLGIYVLLNLIAHSIVLTYVYSIFRSKDELYDKYQRIKKARLIFLLVLFPLPFMLVYFWLGKRLKQLRYQPRFSRTTGKPLHLVSHAEEGRFLENGQVTEEEIGVADYDVWVSDDHAEVQIYRYSKAFHRFSRCPECGYTTYFLAATHTLQAASYSSSGLKEEVHQCKNCNCQHRKQIVLPKLTATPSSSSGGSSGSRGGSWGGGSSGGGGAGVSW